MAVMNKRQDLVKFLSNPSSPRAYEQAVRSGMIIPVSPGQDTHRAGQPSFYRNPNAQYIQYDNMGGSVVSPGRVEIPKTGSGRDLQVLDGSEPHFENVSRPDTMRIGGYLWSDLQKKLKSGFPLSEDEKNAYNGFLRMGYGK